MSTKHKSIVSMILRYLMIVPLLYGLITHLFSLLSSEVRVAKRSLLMILVLSFLIAAIITSTWFCILAMLFLYLHALQLSWMLSLVVLLLVNIIFILILGIIILKAKNNLFFPETTRLLRHMIDNKS